MKVIELALYTAKPLSKRNGNKMPKVPPRAQFNSLDKDREKMVQKLHEALIQLLKITIKLTTTKIDLASFPHRKLTDSMYYFKRKHTSTVQKKLRAITSTQISLKPLLESGSYFLKLVRAALNQTRAKKLRYSQILILNVMN